MKRLSKKQTSYHGTISLFKDQILSQGITPTDGGQGDGAYTTTNYEEAVKYAMDRASALVEYREDNPHETYPIIVECLMDDESCLKPFNGKWLIFPDGIPADRIVKITDLNSDPKWLKLIKLYEIDPKADDFDEYAYTLRVDF